MPEDLDSLFNEASSEWDSLSAAFDEAQDEHTAEENMYVGQKLQTLLRDVARAKWDQATQDYDWQPHEREARWEVADPQFWAEEVLKETPDLVERETARFQKEARTRSFFQASRDRLAELTPALTADLREERPDLAGDDLDVEIRRRVNSVLGKEGLPLVPTTVHKPFAREGLVGTLDELGAALTWAGTELIENPHIWAAETQAWLSEQFGHPETAARFYARAERIRGEKRGFQEKYGKASEDLGELNLSDPRWWAMSIGRNAPQYAAMYLTGQVAGVLGTQLGLSTVAVEALQAKSAVAAVGFMEYSGAYESSIEQLTASGVPLHKARQLAGEQALVVGLTNALLEDIPATALFKRAPHIKSRLLRSLSVMLSEGTTESAQEVTAIMGEVYAAARAQGYDVPAALSNMGRDLFKTQGNRIAAAGVIGLALSGPAAVSSKYKAPTGPNTSAPDTAGVAQGSPLPNSDDVSKFALTEAQAADRLGLIFRGTEGDTALYHDPLTGETIQAGPDDDVAALRDQERARVNQERFGTSAPETGRGRVLPFYQGAEARTVPFPSQAARQAAPGGGGGTVVSFDASNPTVVADRLGLTYEGREGGVDWFRDPETGSSLGVTPGEDVADVRDRSRLRVRRGAEPGVLQFPEAAVTGPIAPTPGENIPFPVAEAQEAAPTRQAEPTVVPFPTKTAPKRTVPNVYRQLAEEKRLRRTSPVTQGPNRVAYDEAGKAIFERADQTEENVGVVRTDLGNFKVANDRLGHDVGDELLKAKAEAFAEGLRVPPQKGRPADYAGNFAAQAGGDEFAAFIRQADSPDDVKAAMDRVTQLFDEKAETIIGDKLPKEAYPFISWGAEIRKAGDTRSLTEIAAAADKAQETHKGEVKVERGIPATREELAAYIDKRQAKTGENVVPAGEKTPTPTTEQKPKTVLRPKAQAAVDKVGAIESAPDGGSITSPSATMEQAIRGKQKAGENVYVRQAPQGVTSNKGRILAVQIASDTIQAVSGEKGADAQYFDKLYRTREGYVRVETPDTTYFWELPQWIGQAAANVADLDVYVVRDVDEATKFLNEAGYDQVAFSALDVNKSTIAKIARGYSGKIAVGGYVADTTFSALPNVTWQDTMRGWVESMGQEFVAGTNYRHFGGTQVQPRLTLSEGCLHGCAFCAVKPRGKLATVPLEDVMRQVESFQDLDFTHVYINDKTFGQASNYTDLETVYKRLKQMNPDFQGFIVQTTAAQMLKLDMDFLKRAGVRYVELGIESYNDGILKAAKKPHSATAIVDKAVAKARKAGIALVPNVLVGLPGETQTTYNHTLNFLRDNQDIISHINAYTLSLYEGTEMTDLLGAKSDIDVDENSVEKSYMKDPALHAGFRDRLSAFGERLLDNPAVGISEPLEVRVQNQLQEDLEGPHPLVRDPITEARSGETSPAAEAVKRRTTDPRSGVVDPELLGVLAGAPVARDVARFSRWTSSKFVDESTALTGSAPNNGGLALEVFQDAATEARRRAAPHLVAWRAALKKTPRLRRGRLLRWRMRYRADGSTNWSTLIEHPERLAGEIVPREIQTLKEVHDKALSETGDWAVREKLPQVQWVVDEKGKGTWEIRPFKKAKTGRYAHAFTAEGRQAMHDQAGPVFEALIDRHLRYPEQNPHLPTNREELMEYLRSRQEALALRTAEGKFQKAASLSYTRVWRELPVAVSVDGKMVDILIRDPSVHFHAQISAETSELALWNAAKQDLLPRFGKVDEETGQVSLPLGSREHGMTDVPRLIDRLRRAVTTEAARKRSSPQAVKAYDRLLANYNGVHQQSVFDDLYAHMGTGPLATFAGILDTAAASIVVQFAPIWDLAGWIKVLPGTRTTGVKAMLQSLWELVRARGEFGLDYEMMGVMSVGHTSYSLRSDSWFRDLVQRNLLRNIPSVPGRATEHWLQFVVARSHDLYLQRLNSKPGSVSRAEAAYLREALKLNTRDIDAIANGKMTPRLRSKALQGAVNTYTGFTEFAFRKGAIQNHPLGKALWKFATVPTAQYRLTKALGKNVAADVKTAVAGKTTESRRAAALSLLQTGATLLAWIAALAGQGFASKYLRRAAMGKPAVDAEDPEKWEELLSDAMVEGGVFGPMYRFVEAWKYSNDDPHYMAANLAFSYGVVLEIAEALMGLGPYKNSPWADRLKRLGVRYSPLYKSISNWHNRIVNPDRESYGQTRKLVRKWRREHGEETSYGPPRGRNPYYYAIFEAILDRDFGRLQQKLGEYKTWAKDKGWDSETARKRLQQSLDSRRPINLKADRRRQFLKELSEDLRNEAEEIDRKFHRLRTRITRKPGVPLKPKGPASPRKPGTGNWYRVERELSLD